MAKRKMEREMKRERERDIQTRGGIGIAHEPISSYQYLNPGVVFTTSRRVAL